MLLCTRCPEDGHTAKRAERQGAASLGCPRPEQADRGCGQRVPGLPCRAKAAEGLEARVAALEARLDDVAAELAELRSSQPGSGRAHGCAWQAGLHKRAALRLVLWQLARHGPIPRTAKHNLPPSALLLNAGTPALAALQGGGGQLPGGRRPAGSRAGAAAAGA